MDAAVQHYIGGDRAGFEARRREDRPWRSAASPPPPRHAPLHAAGRERHGLRRGAPQQERPLALLQQQEPPQANAASAAKRLMSRGPIYSARSRAIRASPPICRRPGSARRPCSASRRERTSCPLPSHPSARRCSRSPIRGPPAPCACRASCMMKACGGRNGPEPVIRRWLQSLSRSWVSPEEVRSEAWALGARHGGCVSDGAKLELAAPGLAARRAVLLRAVLRAQSSKTSQT